MLVLHYIKVIVFSFFSDTTKRNYFNNVYDFHSLYKFLKILNLALLIENSIYEIFEVVWYVYNVCHASIFVKKIEREFLRTVIAYLYHRREGSYGRAKSWPIAESTVKYKFCNKLRLEPLPHWIMYLSDTSRCAHFETCERKVRGRSRRISTMWRLANAWDMRKVKEKCEFTISPMCALYAYMHRGMYEGEEDKMGKAEKKKKRGVDFRSAHKTRLISLITLIIANSLSFSTLAIEKDDVSLKNLLPFFVSLSFSLYLVSRSLSCFPLLPFLVSTRVFVRRTFCERFN